MLQISALNLLGWGLHRAPVATAATQRDESATDSLKPLNRFPRMVQEYFVEQLRRHEQRHQQHHASLQTRADAEAYVASVRQRIRSCFGPSPEKTPLEPRVTGIVDREAYRIEKVIFQSRPGLLVTGNLYVPKGGAFPRPGVLGTCGHSDSGKAIDVYQSFAQRLARLGYVVFIYDPIGQGERLQYPDAALKSTVGVGVPEHIHAGNQQFLVGEFFGAWRAWDGIRALDYLLSRPEVDPRHLGVTGNSGGGTMTTWLCGLDSRLTMAAPSCFVTTFRRNLENELPADTEQCPPRALSLGLDHEDFLAAMAPKPVLILGKEHDYFDVRGTEEAYSRLKRLYALLGAEENIGLFVGPGSHGYSRENREAMYRWFNRVTGVSDGRSEPPLQIEQESTLWCTPKGQVAELGSRPIYEFTRERSKALAAQRARTDKNGLAAALSAALKLPTVPDSPEYRILRALPPRHYPRAHATTYAVQTEPGIHAIVYRLSKERIESRPPHDTSRAFLYISHRSSDAELRDESFLRGMVASEADSAFYTCDVRGIGESQPDTCGQNTFLRPYGSDFFYAIHGLMLDYPSVAQRTFDILTVLEWLGGIGHSEIHLLAKGWGALPATFAALLCPRVTRVTLKNALTAYADIAESERYRWPLATFIPGVLTHFDLPDCYAALRDKQISLIEPWEALAPPESVDKD
jgi:dienelactone hydrolase